MLPKHISAIFLSLAAFSLVSPQRCSRTAIRKEIRDVNVNERKAYFRAFRALGGSRNSFLERQTKVHVDNQLTIHGYPVFLVWHRTFTWLFENALRKVDASVAAHYWDWTKDARSPERSVLFTNDYIGYSNYGSCLNSPNFPRWNTNYPSPHCVSRSFVNGDSPGAFYPRAITDEIRYQSRSYDYYRIRLEGGPHAAPHNGCGGDMSNMQSPSDPMFYLHHSFIDKLFAEWQHDSASRVRMYDGWNYDNSPARLSDQLVGLGRRVQDVINIRSLCYDYQQTRNPNNYGTIYDLPMLLATPPDAGSQNQGSFGVQNDWNSNNWNNNNNNWNNNNNNWNNNNNNWDNNNNWNNNNNNNWDNNNNWNNNNNNGWTDNNNGWNNNNQGWTDNSNQGWTDNSNNGWNNNNGGWLQRRSFSATRPSTAAQPQPAAVEPQAQVAPRPSMPAPAPESAYTPPVPKAAALTFTADIPEERVKGHADKYDEEMAHPRPIDEKWMKMNNICPETQRALESMYCEIINKVNVVIKSKACPEEKK